MYGLIWFATSKLHYPWWEARPPTLDPWISLCSELILSLHNIQAAAWQSPRLDYQADNENNLNSNSPRLHKQTEIVQLDDQNPCEITNSGCCFAQIDWDWLILEILMDNWLSQTYYFTLVDVDIAYSAIGTTFAGVYIWRILWWTAQLSSNEHNVHRYRQKLFEQACCKLLEAGTSQRSLQSHQGWSYLAASLLWLWLFEPGYLWDVNWWAEADVWLSTLWWSDSVHTLISQEHWVAYIDADLWDPILGPKAEPCCSQASSGDWCLLHHSSHYSYQRCLSAKHVLVSLADFEPSCLKYFWRSSCLCDWSPPLPPPHLRSFPSYGTSRSEHAPPWTMQQ